MRGQDELYREAAATHAVALERLARAYEADADKRRDLVQEIHIALWRSFAGFNGTCSMRTWVYRVAHNTATSHVLRERRRSHSMVSLEEIENMADQDNRERAVHRTLLIPIRRDVCSTPLKLPSGLSSRYFCFFATDRLAARAGPNRAA